ELPKSALPRSSTARFSERWQKSLGDEGFLDHIVERWRASAIPSEADPLQNASMMASALGIRESSALDEAVREALAHRRIGQEQPSASSPIENLRPMAPGRGREAGAPPPAGYQAAG